MPIFDQGYQHWSGELSGHGWRWLAIARHGVRTGLKSRILRIALLVAWLPALALAAMLCLWGLLERQSELAAPFLNLLAMFGAQVLSEPKAYRVEIWTVFYSVFVHAELRLSMILILLVGPTLISQDLRFNALPLYLSRPLKRIDYFLGKLGVIAVFLGLVVILPSIVAYLLGLLFSLDLSILRDTFPILLASIAYGLIITVSAGTFILALSSLSRNTRYVGLMWLGIWFVTSTVATILQAVDNEQHVDAARAVARERGQEFSGNDNVRLRGEAEAAETNWRPLVSYVSNLSRIGDELLGTSAAWQKLAALQPPQARGRFLRNNLGPQYPWYWSAGVLAGVFGLSLCILNLRIKSLDRLK